MGFCDWNKIAQPKSKGDGSTWRGMEELGFWGEEKPSFLGEWHLLGAGGFVTCVVLPQVKPVG